MLRCAEGVANKQVASDLGVDESTVDRWRARFVARRAGPSAVSPPPSG
ncbi:helix-turn-helix domain-containing protein [Actinosynnema sp. NPDC023587]